MRSAGVQWLSGRVFDLQLGGGGTLYTSAQLLRYVDNGAGNFRNASAGVWSRMCTKK